MSQPIIPDSLKAPFRKSFKAAENTADSVCHLTAALKIACRCLESSADAFEDITALSLGAKTNDLRLQLEAQSKPAK